MRVKLSMLMFLHYFAGGLSLPIMSLYLSQELGFGGGGAGLILALSAISAVAAPLLGSFVADRVMSAERLFVCAELSAALFMMLLARSTGYVPVLVLYLLFMSVFIPAMALANVIVFHHAAEASRSFGGIRLWGTVGWIGAGWFFSFFWVEMAGGAVADALVFTAAAAAVLGLFALTLPPGEGGAPRRRELVPRAAWRVLRRPEVAIVAVTALLMQVTHRTYYFGAAPYLRHLGFADSAILPALSLGQATEVLGMLLLPVLFRRVTYRIVLLAGTMTELIRFAILALGTSQASAILGIAFHGPTFAFFFTASFIYLDTFADRESRAGVQQLYFVLIEGAGALGGSLLAGHMYDLFAGDGVVDYRRFWMVPMGIAVISIILMLTHVLRSALASRIDRSPAALSEIR